LNARQPILEPEPRGLFALLNFAWIGQGVYVAVKLGIPDHLSAGPRTAAELASLCGISESHAHQVLRALCGFGVFAQDDAGRFRLTPMSEDLPAARNAWMREYVLLWGEQLYPAAGKMLEMTLTGKTGFELAFGRPLYEEYVADPSANARFVNFMNAVTDWQRSVVVGSFDFRPYKHLVDVGGGRASMLTAVLTANAHLRGTILDQPHMSELVNTRIQEARLTERCTFVGGNFLQSVPRGGDLYMIKHVLHDWADDDVQTILNNVSAAMPVGGTLVIVEGALDERNGVDRVMKMRDLEQMVWTGGKVRSQGEFRKLLANAGLELKDVQRNALIDTCLIISTKPPA
jgi:hypothetical protein